jgi:hypothetical protein
MMTEKVGGDMDVGWKILSVLAPVVSVSLLGLIVRYACLVLHAARSDKNLPARLFDFAVHLLGFSFILRTRAVAVLRTVARS